MLEFTEFEKISRLNREVIVTEKIDGTNGQIHIRPAEGSELEMGYDTQIEVDGVPHYIRAGSRNRWVLHLGSDDNNGFGRWVHQHAHELAALGAGTHFGEWWGAGIQRKYGLTEKRWSLFNVGRWKDPGDQLAPSDAVTVPLCCYVVPILTRGVGLSSCIEEALRMLRSQGSFAAPGFMKPEGIVAFHTHSRTLFKVTLERDEEPKSMRKSA
jgi:RNA ligase